ncbi:MAG TPA: hypothetical protein VGG03_16420 [Thermoanaerobaculia bacterium]|jgi:hypothetical protein
MRLRSLAVFPLLYAAAFIAIARSLVGGEALSPFVSWQRLLVRVLAAVGCFAAVSVFERGDHLRRAWLWLGWGTVVIFLRDVLRLLPAFQPANAGPGEQAVLTGLGILSNIALLTGIWMLARSWKMAAISLPGGRSGAVAVGVITAALAILVAGPGALKSALELAGGDWSALVLVVSAVVDIITLCLVAPLLLTAVSLRGGLFSWPWALVTASQLSWLLYDAVAAFGGGPAPGAFPLPDVFRGLAENYLFAAGLAQLFVVRQVRRAAGPVPAGAQMQSPSPAA